MRLVATEYLWLDGVFEEPGRWSFPFFSEQAAQFKWTELQASDALLLGRKTYQGFAAAWPTMTGTGDFGEKMNGIPKYVVSTTLDRVEWSGSKLIKGDVVGEVGKLKQEPGNDLLLSGSAQLFNALMEADLIDLYRLMVHSIVIGGGARLFSDAGLKKTLELTDTKVFGSGIVVLEYQPAKK
ncbi:MAG TPA: dihydrofolate reductase family protein [Candidatus Dormibacteraeota bacterium]|nr:dihydrofolate reductase family protein [Candidatus Dormibacteraeota bacterium]